MQNLNWRMMDKTTTHEVIPAALNRSKGNKLQLTAPGEWIKAA